MDLLFLSTLKGTHEMITEPLNERHCPECGAQMTEVDRHNEKQAFFVWYECSRDGCDGQWLQKISQVS